MIVNYSDFTFVKDEGFIALAYTPDGDEPQIIRRIHLGDSLATTVHAAWTNRGASADVARKAAGQ